jgi:hypothetical protein
VCGGYQFSMATKKKGIFIRRYQGVAGQIIFTDITQL